MRKVIALILLAALVFAAAAHFSDTVGATVAEVVSQPVTASEEVVSTVLDSSQSGTVTATPISVEYDSDDLAPDIDAADATTIRLAGDTITVEGDGVTVDGVTVDGVTVDGVTVDGVTVDGVTVVTITSAGVYNISGTLDDGQIRVDTEDEETVVLVLNGASIACSTSAPIYVLDAEKVVLHLAEGTENTVTDGESYVLDDVESDEPNAAIFSKDDLSINGSGSLTVNARYNNGIASKDDLKITGGAITVDAVNDGIKGKDSIAIRDGIITVAAGGDAMQSTNEEDAEKGYICIDGGSLDLSAGLDGIQAATSLAINDGSIHIVSGGGSQANYNSVDSAKGLKAAIDITITGGVIDIDSADDAIHSNDSITIGFGNIQIAAGDDGIHADSAVTISGGDVNITRSYEGIESTAIIIDGGIIHLVASDDGVNVSNGSGGFAMGGRPGQTTSSTTSDTYLHISGGYLVVVAAGDGLDVNGTATMTDGVVIVNGPTSNGNGALDYDGGFQITGGLLVATGSSGMAQAPDTTSTQYSVLQNFSTMLSAGALVHIETEDGEEILTFSPTNAYQSIVLSSPTLENGETYVVYTGGSSTGTATDGLYSDGVYSPGTQMSSFTISSIVTGGGGGFVGGGGMRGGGRR